MDVEEEPSGARGSADSERLVSEKDKENGSRHKSQLQVRATSADKRSAEQPEIPSVMERIYLLTDDRNLGGKRTQRQQQVGGQAPQQATTPDSHAKDDALQLIHITEPTRLG